MRQKHVNNLELKISALVEELTQEVLLAIGSMKLNEILEPKQAPAAPEFETETAKEPTPKRRRGRPRKNPAPEPIEPQKAQTKKSEPAPKKDWFAAERTPAPPLPRTGPSFAERRKQEDLNRLKKSLLECIQLNPGADAKQAAEKVRAPLGEVQTALDDLVFSGTLTMTSGHHGRCYHRSSGTNTN